MVVAKRQLKMNKPATEFNLTLVNVIKKNGSKVTIQNPETLTQYRRNAEHLKKATFIDKDHSEVNNNQETEVIQREDGEVSNKRRRLPPFRYSNHEFQKWLSYVSCNHFHKINLSSILL